MNRIDISQEIPRLQKQYGDRIVYLYGDFIGAMNSTEALYDEPEFLRKFKVGQPDFDYEGFERSILSNIQIIVEAVDNNLPDLSRIKEGRPKINIAFCRNLWLHQLLADSSWEAESHKRPYLDFAFQEIFREFDTKAVSDFSIEFFPYDMPWGSVTYHRVPSENQAEEESKVYREFYGGPLFDSSQLVAEKQEKLRFNDELNYALRIANRLRNYKKRIFYFDLQQFHLHKEFNEVFPIEEQGKNHRDIRNFFFYYEFKRAMIWNALFLLGADEFRELLDTLKGHRILEAVHRKEAKERKRFLRATLNQARGLQMGKKAEEKESPMGLFTTSLSDEKSAGIALEQEPLPFNDHLDLDLYHDNHLGKAVSIDQKRFMESLGKGLKTFELMLLIDNVHLLGQDEGKLLKNFSDQNNSKIQYIDRTQSDSLSDSHRIRSLELPFSQKPTLQIKGQNRKILCYLYPLISFDRGLVELIAKNLRIEWSDQGWDLLGHHEWVRVSSKNRFYLSRVQQVRDLFEQHDLTPKSLQEIPPEWRDQIVLYLWNQSEDPKVQLEALEYGFKWNLKPAVEYWFSFWLKAVKERRLEHAEQALWLAQMNPELMTELGQEFSIFQKELKNLVGKTEELNKKERKKWWGSINRFLEFALKLPVLHSNPYSLLETAEVLLKEFSDVKIIWKKFLTFIERQSLKNQFKNTPCDYHWLLLQVHQHCESELLDRENYQKQFLEITPVTSRDRRRRISIAIELRDLPKALQEIEAYLKLEPTDTKFQLQEVVLLAATGSITEAIPKLEALLAISSDIRKQQLKGVLLLVAGRKEEALSQFLDIARNLDNSSDARTNAYYQVSQLMLDGKEDRRKAYLEKVIQLQPNHLEANQALMQHWLELGELDKAEQFLIQIKGNGKDQISAVIAETNYLLSTQKTEIVFRFLEDSYSRTNHPGLILILAQLLNGFGEPFKAIERLQKYLNEKPDSENATWMLFEIQIQNKQVSPAILTLGAILKLRPFEEEGLLRIVILLNQAGAYEEAINILDKYSQQLENSLEYYSLKIVSLNQLDEQKQAIQVANHALQRFPSKQFELYMIIGKAYFSLQNYKQAIESFDQAININPKSIKAWKGKAFSNQELGHYKAAISAFSILSKWEPDNAQYYFLQGKIYFDLTKYVFAHRYFQKALKIKWNNKVYLGSSVQSLILLDKFHLALELVEKGLQQFPNEKILNDYKVKILIALDQKEEMKLFCSDALKVNSKQRWAINGYLQSLLHEKKYDQSVRFSEKRGKYFSKFNADMTKAAVLAACEYHQQTFELIDILSKEQPKNNKILGFKPGLLLLLDRESEAQLVFKYALEINKNNTFLFAFQAVAYALLGRYQEALVEIKMAISINNHIRIQLRIDPLLNPLKRLPEYQNLVKYSLDQEEIP